MLSFVVGIILLALISHADSSKLFKRNRNYPLFNNSDVISVKEKSLEDCSLSTNNEHVGFIYNHTDSTCHLLTCVNPDVHNGSYDSKIEVYYQQPLMVNHLLARG